MTDNRNRNKFVDLKINGRLFPSWVLTNFKKYKLPEIMQSDEADPCARKEKEKIRLYQEFLGRYLDYNSPYHDMLIYHGLGSGKSLTAINIYNVLYNYTSGWNVFILLKATLKNNWLNELNKWLQEDEKDFRLANIKFISYDAPNADKSFLDAVKNADTSKKSFYIIEEAHNFIRNVYTNISTRQGKRAQTIYDYIVQDKKENEGVRVILLSGTPAINTPYELALVFNLLRPGIFPKSEAQFNQYYITTSGYESLNEARKNNFQRRIMGLVSYYIGSTPDYFATKTTDYIDTHMSEYQNDIYTYFEQIEDKMEKARKKRSGGSTTYKSYTRQACNFVFPPMAQGMTGESRPRPRNFKISEKEGQLIDRAKELELDKSSDKYYNVQSYLTAVDNFAKTFDNYLSDKIDDDKSKGYTLADDLKECRTNYESNYHEFVKKAEKKSSLFVAMHASSSKMLNIIFNIFKSPGPVLVYSNYVLMEGLQIFKIYLKYFGFSSFVDKNTGQDDFRYTEYHGGIDSKDRAKNLQNFNEVENKYGKLIKIIMISPAGAEGLNLLNTRQVHIMEPYWHETRIVQMVGRAIRMCSHRDLPMKERHVDVFRYKSVREKGGKWTADQQIEDLARGKEGLIQSFLDAIKEAAVDCQLNKNHNLLAQDYKCFQFDEQSLFDDQIGPAYKEDIVDDLRINNGSNSTTSATIRIKVIKIKAVKQLTKDDGSGNVKYSNVEDYWYNLDTGVVYDVELLFAIGKVAIDDNGIPVKKENTVYIIDKMVPIPHIEV